MTLFFQRPYNKACIMFCTKINPDKTEFMLIGNKFHRNKFNSEFPVKILSN